MNPFRATFVLLLTSLTALAQPDAPAPPDSAATPIPPTPPDSTTIVATQRTAEELEQLLGPIALYPDALIALILPASTVPTDIVLAARHLRDNPGDRAQIEHRAWDESVKSLIHYPEVLQWMDENLNWTRQVGEAFATQPADVMQAIQRLRAKAQAAGTLVDTPQQQVIAEPQVIRIVPAQPDVIYVPHYEPDVVFVDRPVYFTRPFLTFGLGVPVGAWLAFDCDWRRNTIWVGNRHRRWTGHDWRRPLVPFAPSYALQRSLPTPSPVRPEVRPWRPAPRTSRITLAASNRFRTEVVRPQPFGRPASRSYSYSDSNAYRSRTYRDSPSSGRNVTIPPTVPAMPRDFSPGFRNDTVGPRVAAPVIAPPLPTARTNRLDTVGPDLAVQPAQPTRRWGADGVRDYGNRSRSFRSTQPATTPPLPVVPAMPMTTPPRSAQPAGPMPGRSFSRGAPAPTVVPTMPVQNRASRPAAVGPVAPPTATQAAPQTAPATTTTPRTPGRRGGGENRGQRGWSGRQ